MLAIGLPRLIAVDMPIGFPRWHSGREAERQTRARLGDRQSSVFAVPSRAAVMCTDYGEACRANLKNSDPPKKVSKQIFHIFPKMREIDRSDDAASSSRASSRSIPNWPSGL